jgi:peptidoglycan/LPS O-acetylase OafA/YrhL
LYYALLFFTFVALPVIHPALKASIFELCHPWQAFPFFLQNLTIRRQAFDTLRVTWSLAIEEQFYLVWPVIVWLAPPRMLKPLALSALFLSMAVRWSVLIGLIPPLTIYMNTLTRLDGLSLGAFLALWIPQTDAWFGWLASRRSDLLFRLRSIWDGSILGTGPSLASWRRALRGCCVWRSLRKSFRKWVFCDTPGK